MVGRWCTAAVSMFGDGCDGRLDERGASRREGGRLSRSSEFIPSLTFHTNRFLLSRELSTTPFARFGGWCTGGPHYHE